MSITSLVRYVFEPRMRDLEKHQTQGELLQRRVLNHLVQTAKNTEYGKKYAFAAMKGYDDFIKHCPVNTYEELKEQIDRMRHGESDVLWKGRVKWYAKSSGTTNDKSKFIPVSAEGLQKIHYAGGFDSVALYLRNNPKSRLFDGRALILGGSHAPNYNLPGSLVGDLSAILIENINPLANLVRVPKKQTALLEDFEIKRERIAREAMNKNVTNISGVPSWMLSVLNCMMEITGKTHLEEGRLTFHRKTPVVIVCFPSFIPRQRNRLFPLRRRGIPNHREYPRKLFLAQCHCQGHLLRGHTHNHIRHKCTSS